jgi:hypothetical protein
MNENITADLDAPPVEPRSARPRPAARWLLWAVIFCSGTVVGAGAALIFVTKSVLWSLHHPDQMPARITARLRSKLDLDEQQTQRVESILRERQAALQAIRRRTQPEVEAELDRLETQIADVLNDRQRGNWRRNFQALRQRWVPPVPAARPE